MSEFKFKIRNVKYFGDTPNEIILDINPRKINFVIAPNGTGKTSFTTAFKCLKTGKIDVPVESKHKKLKNAPSSLSITNNNKSWVANGRSNKISSDWNPFVIDSGIYTNIEAIAVPGGAMVNEPVTRVMSICVKDNIPEQVRIRYNYKNIKASFGAKKGALKDYSQQINSEKFLLALKDALPCLQQFNNIQTPKSRVEQLVSIINNKDGNIRTLKDKMTDADFKTIEQYKHYKEFKASFAHIIGRNSHKLDYFLLFYQLMKIYEFSPNDIKKAVTRAEYSFFKNQLKLDLECVSCPWKGASLREFENNLYIDYPLVNEYSNGQRDIMTLYSKMLIFKQRLANNKKYLLILDEVFDYLDDANLLAAQYFVSTLLEHNKNNTEVYIILLTHINPDYYRTSYVLRKYINIQYMIPQEQIANESMKKFIGYRNWLKNEVNKEDEAKTELYKKLSNYMFHYHPSDCNCRPEIEANQYQKHPARVTWGEKKVLYEYLIKEVNKYLTNIDYDPYAVAFAIRIRVEKLAYDLIKDEDVKSEFLNSNTSYDKIDVCTKYDVQVPLFYMMTLAIGNEASHLYLKNDEYQEKEMVYKLRNNIIKKIISKMFDFENDPSLPLSLIFNM